MKHRHCDFCGDETGACVQAAPCEARERLQLEIWVLRVERRLARPLTPTERWHLDRARWGEDRLVCRAVLLGRGVRLHRRGSRLRPG
jgi:hypothetical protein